MSSGEIPAARQVRAEVNPATNAAGSVLAVTSASAADASRHDSGRPDTAYVIDPDTSSASIVRFPVGSTAPNAA